MRSGLVKHLWETHSANSPWGRVPPGNLWDQTLGFQSASAAGVRMDAPGHAQSPRVTELLSWAPFLSSRPVAGVLPPQPHWAPAHATVPVSPCGIIELGYADLCGWNHQWLCQDQGRDCFTLQNLGGDSKAPLVRISTYRFGGNKHSDLGTEETGKLSQSRGKFPIPPPELHRAPGVSEGSPQSWMQLGLRAQDKKQTPCTVIGLLPSGLLSCWEAGP